MPEATVDRAHVQLGDHACSVYERDADREAVLASFVRDGLTGGDKVLYLADRSGEPAVVEHLRRAGVPADAFLGSGQFAILGAVESYLEDGEFDPDRMLDRVRDETDRAVDAGYRALRLTGEMTWSLRGAPGSDRLPEYERRVGALFGSGRLAAVCQYDQRRFDPDVISAVTRVHAVQVIGTEARPPRFAAVPTEQPPGVRLSGELDAAGVGRLAAVLREASRARREIVLDLGELSFVDVCGLRVIVSAAAAAGAGHRVLLRSVTPFVRRLLALCEWDHLVELADDTEPGDAAPA